MLKIIENTSEILSRATGILVVIMLSIAMVSLNFQVFTRYIVGEASSWSEELAMFLFSWSILLVGSLGIRESFHVKLTFILDFFPNKIRFFLDKFLLLLTLIFGIIFATSGVEYVQATLGQVSAAVRYPIEWLHFSAPVTGILISIHSLALLLKNKSSETLESEKNLI